MSEQHVTRVYRAEFDVRASRRIIEGRAVPYNVAVLVSDDGRTSYREEWMRGVFRRATEPANTGRVKLVYTHRSDTSLIDWVGRAARLEEREDGLYGEWRVDASPVGDAVLA